MNTQSPGGISLSATRKRLAVSGQLIVISCLRSTENNIVASRKERCVYEEYPKNTGIDSG